MLRPTRPFALALACATLPMLGACDKTVLIDPNQGDGQVADQDQPMDLSAFEDVELPANEDIEPTGQPCSAWENVAPCLDKHSVAFCAEYDLDTETYSYGACIPLDELECIPGEVYEVDEGWCSEVTCRLASLSGVPTIPYAECEGEPPTPLVLRFDDAPITMIAAEMTPAASFDIEMAADESSCISTDWPSAATPWLAVDLDGNGSIDGGHELFGSGTDLAGGKARNGFLALAAYDSNADGQIDARDAAFDRLLLWRDHDADRLSVPGELETLVDAGITTLGLGYIEDRRCDARGNCGLERAAFDHAGGRGELVDIHLPCR